MGFTHHYCHAHRGATCWPVRNFESLPVRVHTESQLVQHPAAAWKLNDVDFNGSKTVVPEQNSSQPDYRQSDLWTTLMIITPTFNDAI
jgi:hypothetical protein